ncbi:DMSO/TMAO reductase YedYZ molybdopterin-dependent catalytic subunit [Catenuloplanes nepalensis]|uniref:DMSO/TMAO reductase YedYZ molybdopterin-dependent catalytic subunit n=1 Tax=Catenuloplanes nepalensis TaxID=587533 RepID=A0ABT9MN23_9ACTN|nr:sulfite oxidase [Catenuloplanes nepalensis]MDP9792836.1 DMSO/TMAO reductase YedYZ molybdopterin-dependent catalytic subunit [Catenuloplanes nepalensis]
MDETTYDRLRLEQWRDGRASGRGFTRRDLMRLAAAVGVGGAIGAGSAGGAARAADGPIVKPLPPELFTVFGTNAETRWESLKDTGYLVPVDRFFVRNHTSTPIIDPVTYRLKLFGSGLRAPVEFSLDQLKRLPRETITAAVECAGNGRSLFTTQQGQTVSGTAWKLGAIGVGRWHGVRLGTVLRAAGLRRDAVDVQPQGLDANFVSGGVDLGPVRRPLPIGKALDDVLLAWELNDAPLPPDHGAPLRVVVPSWIGISSIKWAGAIEVAAEPLFSPWNTQFYRLFGADHPAEGTLIDEQVVKSAFELAWGATLPLSRTTLTGRSWSANGPIRHVDVSTDGGTTWRRAHTTGPNLANAWQRWRIDWSPATAGQHTLIARATDVTGATQPVTVPHNTLGYLFGAQVRHPVTVA